MPRYSILWHVEPRFARSVRKRALSALVRRALRAENVPAPAALGIAVTDDEAVRDLNRRYRDEDAPTDVLSFALGDDGGFASPPESLRQVGEVVISYPTAARQARAAGHTIDFELAHLLVHGVLHLLGYDHERPAQARAMRAREDALLGAAAH